MAGRPQHERSGRAGWSTQGAVPTRVTGRTPAPHRLACLIACLVAVATLVLGGCGGVVPATVPSGHQQVAAPGASAASSGGAIASTALGQATSAAGSGGATASTAPGQAAGAPPTPVGWLPGEPDPSLTPGALNPAVTPATIGSTVCRSGWTATVRPPVSYTNQLKVQQIRAYHYADTSTAAYEEDHLIPLELGGAPSDPRNLWPEPYSITLPDGTPVGARVKDAYEDALHREVCAGTLTLAEARARIGIHWVHAYFGIPLAAGTSNASGATAGGAGSAAGAAPTAVPSPSATPRTTASGSALAVRLSSVPASVPAGSSATVAARTTPGAVCSIAVVLPSGRVSTVKALLQQKTADAAGVVAWTWTITSNTGRGTAGVSVTCTVGGRSATAAGTFTIG